MSSKLKRYLRFAVCIVCTLLLVVLLGWVFAPALLMIDSGAQTAEAVVVLGGEPQTRPNRGAEVFKESQAALVIVSGNGDCQDVRRQMEARGVPGTVIETECDSRSTWENALFSVKLLRARQATNVVLVTSWYHSRRALACFQTAAPEMHFLVRPTQRAPVDVRHPDAYTTRRVFQ